MPVNQDKLQEELTNRHEPHGGPVICRYDYAYRFCRDTSRPYSDTTPIHYHVIIHPLPPQSPCQRREAAMEFHRYSLPLMSGGGWRG